jgi:hypothetical protein
LQEQSSISGGFSNSEHGADTRTKEAIDEMMLFGTGQVIEGAAGRFVKEKWW